MRQLTIIFFVLLISFAANAQHTLSQLPAEEPFLRGKELFTLGRYSAARINFERYLQSNPTGVSANEANLLVVQSALKSNHADAITLAENYLASPQADRNHINGEIGLYYFNAKKYDRAVVYFERVSSIKSGNDDLLFKSAYAYYKTGNEAEALKRFKSVSKDKKESYIPAAYYAGYILFHQQKYEQALPYLQVAADDQRYSNALKPLLADIYFRQGKKEALIALADEIRENAPNAQQVYLLAGEMYFLDKKYNRAVNYFEKAIKRTRGSDYTLAYKTGFSYAQLGQEAKAIDFYKQAALDKDTIGQFASYQLGKLYQNQRNLTFAATAFYNASRLNYDTDLQKSALLHYGKVNFEAGKFKEAIDAFTDYNNKYPQDANSKEVNELIGKAFLQTNDYDLAIKYIENLPQKSAEIRETYQKVCFLKGIEVFNQSQFFQSVQYFKKSLSSPIDKELEVAALFWTGEAYSIGKKFDEAATAYRSVIAKSPRSSHGHRAHYGLAYVLYNTKQYKEAIPYFERFVQARVNHVIPKAQMEDAKLRLGDVYFAEKLYAKAVEQYQVALEGNESQRDYISYQMGMAYALNNEDVPAQQQFAHVMRNFPTSVYLDDAYFQTAQIDFESGSYDRAISGFSEVIEKFPSSNLTPYAYLRRAIAHANLKAYEKTEADYIAIITQYPNHATANSAILGLQEAMTATGKPDAFERYLQAYKAANPESTHVETLDFEAAKSQYFSQNYPQAIERFRLFLEKNPKSQYADEANYYLADAFFRSGKPDLALERYYPLLAATGSPFYLRSVGRVASLELAKENFDTAIKHFHILKNNARSNRDRTDAFLGLMEAFFAQKKYDSTRYYALQIVDIGGNSFGSQSKAFLHLGKSAYEQRKYDEAVDYFINTINIAKDEAGAEAQYGMAKVYFDQKNFQQSIQTLYDLNSNFASYDYWLGKSFMLIADNFVALGELFQAEATLSSVIEKSPVAAIQAEAKAKLQKLEELKKNAGGQKQEKRDSID